MMGHHTPPPHPVGGPPYDVREADPRIESMAEKVAQRLRPVCGDMPEAAFRELTHAVARRQLRWG